MPQISWEQLSDTSKKMKCAYVCTCVQNTRALRSFTKPLGALYICTHLNISVFFPTGTVVHHDTPRGLCKPQGFKGLHAHMHFWVFSYSKSFVRPLGASYSYINTYAQFCFSPTNMWVLQGVLQGSGPQGSLVNPYMFCTCIHTHLCIHVLYMHTYTLVYILFFPPHIWEGFTWDDMKCLHLYQTHMFVNAPPLQGQFTKIFVMLDIAWYDHRLLPTPIRVWGQSTKKEISGPLHEMSRLSENSFLPTSLVKLF